jgi:quinol-cytochrome oxidoreductase complex cytochrome b subunit
MTIRDYIGTSAIVLMFFIFMILNIEIDILKKEHVVLQRQVMKYQKDVQIANHKLDSIERVPKHEYYIYK